MKLDLANNFVSYRQQRLPVIHSMSHQIVGISLWASRGLLLPGPTWRRQFARRNSHLKMFVERTSPSRSTTKHPKSSLVLLSFIQKFPHLLKTITSSFVEIVACALHGQKVRLPNSILHFTLTCFGRPKNCYASALASRSTSTIRPAYSSLLFAAHWNARRNRVLSASMQLRLRAPHYRSACTVQIPTISSEIQASAADRLSPMFADATLGADLTASIIRSNINVAAGLTAKLAAQLSALASPVETTRLLQLAAS